MVKLKRSAHVSEEQQRATANMLPGFSFYVDRAHPEYGKFWEFYKANPRRKVIERAVYVMVGENKAHMFDCIKHKGFLYLRRSKKVKA